MQKPGRKEGRFFSVQGMVEKKENGIWEKDTAEVQFLGGGALFAANLLSTPPSYK